MNKILLGFIAISLLTLVGCENEKTKLKGKVKSGISSIYDVLYENGELKKNEIIEKRIYKYDENGNETEKAHYDSDGSLDFKNIFKYEYDSKGNWTKKIYFDGEWTKENYFVVENGITIVTEIIETEIEYYD